MLIDLGIAKQAIIEKDILRSARKSPYIVRLKETFQTRTSLCFILEYCPGGELFYYLS